MDPNTDVIDPLKLSLEEVNYELKIRNIDNVTNPRAKITILRKTFSDEANGISTVPKNCSEINPSDVEINICNNIYGEIVSIANYGMNKNERNSVEEAYHRMLHLQMRLERITPANQLEAEKIYELTDCCVDGIFRVTTYVNSRSENATWIRSKRATVSDSILLNDDAPEWQAPANNLGIVSGASGNNAIPKSTTRPSISPRTIFSNGNGDHQLKTPQTAATASIQGRESFIGLDLLSIEDREEVLNIIKSKIQKGTNATVDNANDQITDTAAHATNQNYSWHQNRLLQPQQLYPQAPLRMPTFNNMPNEAGNIAFPPWANFNENAARQSANRRPVPINQWKISFSGDGKGLHLHDFLAQVELLQKSERLSDEDLVYGLAHLLTGTARTWLTTVQGRFRAWSEVATAMKQRFLPDNYDYMLLHQISNNTQKPSESIVEFLTNMNALFNCLTIPITEQHKLFLIQKNLLPKYAMSIAPLGICSMERLLEVGRRMDCAFLPQSQQLPFQPNTGYFKPNPRNISLIDDTNNDDESNQVELLELRRRNQTVRTPIRCWNCNATGHSFHDCPSERTGLFCYRCGSQNVTSISCKNCPKNGRRSSSQAVSNAQDSARTNQ